ncbi:hypothetical protein C1E24_06695 [Pseudoalteromonas phenolica]|uniref:Uncharacterized protein n=1 Tax=Pseudoalteromonas phenolica TaxID=161398 RepID=A0A5R9Q6M0_9GAMM|nr:hypothetical protein [Pseudoalteromonas phenolica]TLX47919.1 hypothetical protein C1E24_06695 [Pseudoalteromonas phenolica]
MRLFIFNNGKLKHVLSQIYTEQDTLYEVFKDDLKRLVKDLDRVATERREGLWAPAILSCKNMKFVDSKGKFRDWDKENQQTQGGIDSKYNNAPNAFDFYLDRGTGWIGLAKNYSIINEINNSGKIEDKNKSLTSDVGYPWNNYKNTQLWGLFSTKGFSEEIAKLEKGGKSIIPPSVGGFYTEDSAMTKNNFEMMLCITNKLAATIKAIVNVEWPAVAYDNAVFALYSMDRSSNASNNAKLAYEGLIKNLSDHNGDFGSPPKKESIGKTRYLDKLKAVENLLVVSYRQMRMMTKSYHFDSSSLDLAWYQKFYSGILWTIESLLGVVASIVGSVSASGVTKLGAAGINVAGGAVGKELLSAIALYVGDARQKYERGGQKQDVNIVLDKMMDTLLITYTTFELFLMTWGLEKHIVGATEDKMQKKLTKVRLLLEAKVRNKTLDENDPLLAQLQ